MEKCCMAIVILLTFHIALVQVFEVNFCSKSVFSTSARKVLHTSIKAIQSLRRNLLLVVAYEVHVITVQNVTMLYHHTKQSQFFLFRGKYVVLLTQDIIVFIPEIVVKGFLDSQTENRSQKNRTVLAFSNLLWISTGINNQYTSTWSKNTPVFLQN